VSAVGGRVEQLMSLIIHVRNGKKKKKSVIGSYRLKYATTHNVIITYFLKYTVKTYHQTNATYILQIMLRSDIYQLLVLQRKAANFAKPRGGVTGCVQLLPWKATHQ
jgi:hypothetical protein